MKALSRIFGYGERYILTSTGVILHHRTGHIKTLSSQVTNAGYELVHLNNTSKRKAFTVHRLVALHFIPNPENKKFVNHKDGNKLNNDVENLEWCTPKENVDHAHETGLMSRKGEKNSKSKFKDQDILTIRTMIANGDTNVAIAKVFSVDPSTISVIRHGKTWKHIAPPETQTTLNYD